MFISVCCGCTDHIVDRQQEKCDHYWPVDIQPMFYGDLKVEIQNENRTADWIITKMKVSFVSFESMF